MSLPDVTIPSLTADAVVQRFGLQPLPGEGGWFRRIQEAGVWVEDSSRGRRRAWSTILALFTATGFSAMHRLAVDEVWTWLTGDPMEMLSLRADGTGTVTALGRTHDAGEVFQRAVPTGVWQGARVARAGGWSLVSCICVPEYRDEDFELGRRDALSAAFPAWKDQIRALTRE